MTDKADGFKGGIPTARYVDHAGYTVPDLDEAVSFFVDVLGCELVYEAGPYSDPRGDSLLRRLDIHPRSVLRVAMLRCGPTTNVELVEIDVPDRDLTPPKASDVGGVPHLTFHVDDMEAAIAYLEEQPGVRILERLRDGEDDGTEEGGQKNHYFVTPWGMYMELFTPPERPRYERETPARLFRPATA